MCNCVTALIVAVDHMSTVETLEYDVLSSHTVITRLLALAIPWIFVASLPGRSTTGYHPSESQDLNLKTHCSGFFFFSLSVHFLLNLAYV